MAKPFPLDDDDGDRAEEADVRSSGDSEWEKRHERRRRRNAPWTGLQVAGIAVVLLVLILMVVGKVSGRATRVEQYLDMIHDAVILLIAAVFFCAGCVIREMRNR